MLTGYKCIGSIPLNFMYLMSLSPEKLKSLIFFEEKRLATPESVAVDGENGYFILINELEFTILSRKGVVFPP